MHIYRINPKFNNVVWYLKQNNSFLCDISYVRYIFIHFQEKNSDILVKSSHDDSSDNFNVLISIYRKYIFVNFRSSDRERQVLDWG